MDIRCRTAAAALAFSVACATHAEVVRFEVTETAPAFAGRSFGEVGPYVKVVARATIAIDPADPRNAVIADVDRAPRNAAGRVEAVADVVLLRPADPARGNGTLLLDVPNRGRLIGPQMFDDAVLPGGTNALSKAEEAGVGFLERQGYTIAWIGWQGDIASRPGQLAIATPVLPGVTGTTRDEFQFDHRDDPAKATLSWPIADPASVVVTVRQSWDQPRQTPAGLAVRVTGAKSIEITRPAGFDAGALYEVTYVARDPAVLGLGFAATRDIVSFLRRQGDATNPLAFNGRSSVQHAIGFGLSQSGRFLRDFLHLGFNADTAGRIVFDGLMPHITGARRMATNQRFGQPGRNARHPQDPAWQVDQFPFTYQTMADPLSGRRDGLMLRCRLDDTCPRVFQTDSEHEWWGARASLLVTDVAGNHLDLPADVRAYMIAGTPHYAAPNEAMRRAPTMALPVNPMHAGPPMRALLTAMRDWITAGVAPPASRVPMRAHGTLAPAADAVPRDVPGLPYEGIHAVAAFSDQSVFPPRELGRYPVFVPLADRDGMSVAGIRMLPLAVPRATYTGWNPRAPGYGPGALFPLQGAVLPFAATRAEREAARDPRPSLAERYADDAAYVAAVRAAAQRQVAERLLLQEDADRAVELARQGRLDRLK